MINPMKLKLLDELIDYMSHSQGNDLKSLLTEKEQGDSPEVEDLEKDPSVDSMDDSGVKPKGVAIEKVSVLGKPKTFDEKAAEAMEQAVPSKDEPSDDELEELLAKLGRK